jgi:hypothetical protein
MSRRSRAPGRTAQQAWDGGIRGRAISPSASYEYDRGGGVGDDNLLQSFASSADDLGSTMTLGGAEGGGDGVAQELIAELKETQGMVLQMEEQMEEQEDRVRASERRARELKDQLEQERLPLLHADAQRSVLEEKLKDAMRKKRELESQCSAMKKQRGMLRAAEETDGERAETVLCVHGTSRHHIPSILAHGFR